MDEEPPIAEWICECGAANQKRRPVCWLCGQAMAGAVTEPAENGNAARQRITFRLSSLMLTVTLIAVCLGVFRLSPGLGIFFTVVIAPAFVRTAAAAMRRRAAGDPMDAHEKLAAMVASIGVVVTVGIAAGFAFFVVGWSVCAGAVAVSYSTGLRPEVGMGISLLVGILAALVVGGMLVRATWRVGS